MRNEKQPLAGLRVGVTRPRAQADSLARALADRGAEPVICPMIRIAPPADPASLERSSRRLEGYDWVVFTSVNGVAALLETLRRCGTGPKEVAWPRVACIGPATAAAARTAGLEPELVPDDYVAEALLEALGARAEAAGELETGAAAHAASGDPVAGRRFLLPRAAGARPLLREGLEARGAEVDEVEAYRAVPDEDGIEELRRRLAGDDVDVLTFTSSSTVENCVAAVGAELGSAGPGAELGRERPGTASGRGGSRWNPAVIVAAIGPITAATARSHGLPVQVQAREYTIGGLVDALCEYRRAPAAAERPK